MELKLTAVFEEVSEAEGGGYVASVDELPGAITEGETLEEARANLLDAIELLLEANRAEASEAKSDHKIIREQITLFAA